MWRKVHFVLPDSEQVVQDSSGDEAQADIDLRPGYSMEEDLLAKVDPRMICSTKNIARFGTYKPDPKDLRTTLKKVYYSAARRQMLARVRKRRIPPPLDPDGYATDECYPRTYEQVVPLHSLHEMPARIFIEWATKLMIPVIMAHDKKWMVEQKYRTRRYEFKPRI